MRRLTSIIIVVFLAWSGWWYAASTAHKKAWSLWLDDRARAGWVAEHAGLAVRGYPNRLDTTLTDLQLADPVSGWAWSAPFFQVLSLSYKPNHVIAVWPGSQKVSAPTGTADITAETMRGSLVFVPSTDLTLDRMQLEIADLAIAGPGWNTALKSANFATRRAAEGTAPGDNAHDIGLDIRDLDLPIDLKSILDPRGILPQVFQTAQLDITIAYDAPWDRHAIETTKPQPTAISVKDLTLNWGDLELKARGILNIDADGYPAGDLNLKARNWREIINLFVSAGVLPADVAESLKSGLGLLANLSGDPRSIDIPLRYANQFTFLGPIPLGPAPRLATH